MRRRLKVITGHAGHARFLAECDEAASGWIPRPTRPAETSAQTLDPRGLYEGDNGRIFCSDPACAGASASFTGWTISGLKVRRLGDADRKEWMDVMGRLPRCEGCGRGETR